MTDKSGTEIGRVPMVQYPLNDQQTILVFGGKEEPLELDGKGEVDWTFLGRLDDQSFMIESMTRNSLLRDGWDFDCHPNPFISLGDCL